MLSEPEVTPTVVAGNEMDVGKKLMPCVADSAVPESATVCGLPVALSVNVSEDWRMPASTGFNTTETVHVAPERSEVVQVFVEMAKSVESTPAMAMLLIVAVVAPVFFTVVVCAALVLPVMVTGKDNVAGVKVRVVAAPARVVEAHSPAIVRAMRRVRSVVK